MDAKLLHPEDAALFKSVDLTTWENFPWPDWVPEGVRAQVESFWSEAAGRIPLDWLYSAANPYSKCPPLGTLGTFRAASAAGDEPYVEGRYVHAWNNMGRVVLEDGGYVVVSSGLVQLEELQRAPQFTECDRRLAAYRTKLLAALRPIVEKEWCGTAVLEAIDKTKP